MLSHEQKIKLARKLRSNEEIKNHVPIFDTKNWRMRHQEESEIKDNIRDIITPKLGFFARLWIAIKRFLHL